LREINRRKSKRRKWQENGEENLLIRKAEGKKIEKK
jgi:hypothetical protein